jgi:hypothetical protein
MKWAKEQKIASNSRYSWPAHRKPKDEIYFASHVIAFSIGLYGLEKPIVTKCTPKFEPPRVLGFSVDPSSDLLYQKS